MSRTWPSVITGVALVIVLLLIAVPAWIRSVVKANEAQAIGDTRNVISAEQTYASSNCGYFAPLTELTRADDGKIGIPDYPENAPEFLDGTLGREVPYEKDGYIRDWIGNPPASLWDLDTTKCDDESVLDYCYGSTPANPLSGSRSFSGVGTGSIQLDMTGRDICPLNEYIE